MTKSGLPDDANWVDKGCEVAPACLACPLEVCRYEMPRGIASVRLRERVPLIIELQGEGLTHKEIGKRLGVSRRGIQRSLRAAGL